MDEILFNASVINALSSTELTKLTTGNLDGEDMSTFIDNVLIKIKNYISTQDEMFRGLPDDVLYNTTIELAFGAASYIYWPLFVHIYLSELFNAIVIHDIYTGMHSSSMIRKKLIAFLKYAYSKYPVNVVKSFDNIFLQPLEYNFDEQYMEKLRQIVQHIRAELAI